MQCFMPSDVQTVFDITKQLWSIEIDQNGTILRLILETSSHILELFPWRHANEVLQWCTEAQGELM